ncbi:MAG TPA: PD-(D/E)XK nuclease family protein [Gemmataceae bacterium]|nr:PD-(D/E)XK nuclease family protein [Gemmataceae bacterium]
MSGIAQAVSFAANRTARVHVLCGPSGSGKTARLLERFRAAAEMPGAALWIGPTRRAIEALRLRALHGGAGGVAPRFVTFQELADEIIRANDPTARPLSNPLRRLLAEDVLDGLHQRGRLPHFAGVAETRGFGEGVLGLLAELKRNEVRPEELARAAVGDKDRQCARLYARYQQLLTRHALFDLEGRLWHARDLLARGLRRPFEEGQAVFVDGFTDFTRTQRDLLQALALFVGELWITLPDEPGDDRAELFTRPRATLTRLQLLRPHVEWLDARAGDRPAGLAHLARQLFRPLRKIEPSGDAAGLLRLEAPGLVGEARLAARHVKRLLLDGTPADDILIAARDLAPYADLLREVFAEYGIPLDVEGAEPLARNRAVAALLRALRLPEDDWPFAAVTALLRSGYFRPDWPEAGGDAEMAGRAEALLRLLGEPRGRDAYRKAVARWAEQPEPGLEDEAAEESRRRMTHELARRCRPFLERFFRGWDDAPHKAPLADHVAWLRRFAEGMGIIRSAADDPRDRAALARLWAELESWQALERLLHPGGRELDRRTFLKRLGTLAAEAGLARAPRGPGRVRVLSAELARHLDVPCLFLLGLGERGFPRLAAPEPIFDEPERQALRQAGLDFPAAADLMPDEMLLFYQLATRARRLLVLSCPAVDDKGQPLLPSSFLSAVLDCFHPNAIPVERRTMLIEGHDRDTPLSPAEYRVRAARLWDAGGGCPAGLQLPADLADHLARAGEMARRRLGDRHYSPYDGLFRDGRVIAEVAELFHPGQVFSPTALEDYVACPFRFFLRHVLRLQPLEEPREEIEVTRRGQAFHRALSRLHRQLKDAGVHQPDESVDAGIVARLGEAVGEYVRRAPSQASKALWELEGQRLLRAAARYRAHWQRFVEPWLPLGTAPRPYEFEVDFGLPAPDGTERFPPLVIRVGDIEVRVSGRIDRVDVAEWEGGVGFWIIDYKTGRAGHYTAGDLSEFRRLQLTLYALAVEEVLLAGRGARPLGLAYWLVTDGGPKVVLPTRNQVAWLNETEKWRAVREELRKRVAALAAGIRRGAFPLRPQSERCTETCDFAEACRINQARPVEKEWELPVV